MLEPVNSSGSIGAVNLKDAIIEVHSYLHIRWRTDDVDGDDWG